MARYRTEQMYRGPAAAAFRYLSDFTTTQEWDPGISEATRIDDGPLRVGSKFRVISKSGSREIPFVYEVCELDPPRRIRLVGEGGRFRSEDVITVEARSADALVTYEANLTFTGALQVFSPLLSLVFKRLGDRAADGMRAALDRLALTPPPAT